MDGPLSGMKVLDLTIWVQGPLAAQLLGDLGADVVKIEKPGQGDFSRGLQTLYGASMRTSDGKALLWELANRNKKSIAIDLRREEGQRLLHQLVGEADVFVTNILPRTLAQFGATPEQLMAVNPRLVYALGGGLGVQGDLAGIAAQDTTGTAYSGLMYTLSRDGTPYYAPGALADLLSGTNLAFAAVAALLRREKNGRGELVSTSLLQGMLWLQQLHVGAITNVGEHLRPFDPKNAANAFLNLYQCADGEWLALGMTAMTRDDWFDFCDVIDRADLKEDERFVRNRGRIDHAHDLVDIISQAMATRPRDEWVARIVASGLPCAPVRHLEELLADPKVLSEDVLTTTPSGMTYVRAPFNLEGVPARSDDAPTFAGDTFEVLTGLGLTPEQIAGLQEGHVVW
ncbi:MAG TPA: CaiB/BaiF CoA-transferase family protein [Dehalococcoidia bacterium]|nr:CaiB/BaiF CoA-transferase family protein [Dehalococcoidia bacterium]